MDEHDITQETPAQDVFVPPSIYERDLLYGGSYTHHSAIPQSLSENMSTECCIGIDEAGRGPVLGETSFVGPNTDLLMVIRSYGIWTVLSAIIPAS